MKISMIVTLFHGNRYIERLQQMMIANEEKLIESNQKNHSEFEMEVIFVNDSPDERVALSALYAATKKNWLLINNEVNLGIHGARVEGLKRADGDYVLFLDQDDYLQDETALVFLTEAGRHPGRVLVSNCLFELKDRTNLLYRTDYQKERVGSLEVYLTVGTQIVSPGQCAIPKELIPKYWCDHLLKTNGADDYYLWLLMLGNGEKFYYVDKPLYTHAYTGENLSGATAQTDASIYEFLPLLRESGSLDEEEVATLERMIRYKAQFRVSNIAKKAILSLRNLDLFINNLIFKKKSETPYGFNR